MRQFLNKDRERRKDFLDKFDDIIEFALTERPDIILISGDLFDNINPRNPVRKHVIQQFKLLYNRKIKIFAIGGNHDIPKSIENALSPISILNTIEYLDFIQPEGNFITKRQVDIDNIKINVFGESYDVLNSGNRDPLDDLKFPDIDGDVNIFMVHGSIGLFNYRSPGDYIIKEINIPEEINYVAAGHLHDHLEKTRYNPNLGTTTELIYPGSIEFLSFNENLEKSKGFMFLEYEKEGLINKEFIKLETRPIKIKKIPININVQNIYSKIVSEINPLRNPDLILKVILDGKIKTDQIPSMRTAKVIDFGDDNFFKLLLDNYNHLTFETSELTLPDREDITPKEVFIRYTNQLLEKEENEVFKKRLEKAKKLGLKKLRKFGVG